MGTAEGTIAVIGAGLAGLSAAKKLRDSYPSFSVRVLEAGARVGGRAHTVVENLEMGATWAHGKRGNPVYSIADSRGLATPPPLRKPPASGVRSKWLVKGSGEANSSDVELALSLHSAATERAEHVPQRAKNVSLAHCVAEQVDAYEREHGQALSDTAHAALRWRENLQSAIDGSESNADLGVENMQLYDVLDEQNVRLSSFQRIAESLSKDAGKIELNTAIQSIRDADDGVDIQIGSGSVKAAVCILAVPLGVLQAHRISFEPQLPERTLDAFNAIRIGAVEKVHFILPYPLSEMADNSDLPQSFNFLRERDGAGSGVWWPSRIFSLWREADDILLAWLTGKQECIQMAERSDQQLINDLMSELNHFDVEIPRPSRVIRSSWTRDENFGGSYSYLPPGVCREESVDVLNESHWGGKLQFAGEHCSAHRIGTADGAFSSGKDAGDRAAELLQCR
jgi:monoamine oxidase